MSDIVVLKVMSKENTYTHAIQGKWLSDKVALGKVCDKKVQTPMYACHVKGLDPSINLGKQQRISEMQ